MSEDHPSDNLQPPMSEWASLLAANRAHREKLGDSILGVSCRRMREQLLEAAYRYTRELVAVAAERGVAIPAASPPIAEAPLVMTGHQPVVFHSGLLFKEEALNAFARANGCTALSVTIDSDEGDAGRITWPAIENGLLAVREGSLAQKREALYGDQILVGGDAISSLTCDILNDMLGGGMAQLQAPLLEAMKVYERLSGLPMMQANSIVRRALCGLSHLEVPLTELAVLPEARSFLERMASQPKELAALYNSVLDEYRAAHKIKNAANPFPNMTVEEGSVELPLWTVADEGRSAVRLQASSPHLPKGGVIVPRGSIVTLLLRGYCADLFIHGLGGAKYDQFVESFAARYLQVSLPPFAVASRTRYVFPDKVRDLQADLQLKAALKEMVSHPQKFVGQGLFSDLDEQELLAASRDRAVLLSLMREAKDDSERSRVAHQLNALNQRVRELLGQTQLYRRLQSSGCSDNALRQWSFREFPFFLCR